MKAIVILISQFFVYYSRLYSILLPRITSTSNL